MLAFGEGAGFGGFEGEGVFAALVIDAVGHGFFRFHVPRGVKWNVEAAFFDGEDVVFVAVVEFGFVFFKKV